MQITKRDLLLGGLAAAAFAFAHHHEDMPPERHLPHGRPGRSLPPAAPNLGTGDKTVTHKFIETAYRHPLVTSLRRSVGLTEIDTDVFTSQGSAVLLDRMGTLALTAHQVDSNVMKVRFLPHPDRALLYCSTSAVLIAQDKKTDTSYWRLVNPGVIDAFGLQPVQWGHIGNGEHHSGETVLAMGFPGTAHGELDAATHKIEEYLPSITEGGERMLPNGKVEEFTQPVNCKIEMTDPIGAGGSGGGIFDDITGCFLGTATTSSNLDSQFTPADAIWNGYVNLVPAAKQYHFAPQQLLHKECDIHGSYKGQTLPGRTYH